MAIRSATFRGVHSAQSPECGVSVTTPAFAFVSKLVAVIATAFGLGGCDRARTPDDSGSRPGPAVAPPSPTMRTGAGGAPDQPPPTASAQRSEPQVLLALPTSAYQASLAVDDDAAYLLTGHAAYKLSPAEEPMALKVELGYGASATRHG